MNDSIDERFTNKIRIDRESNCWVWKAYLNRTGYGLFRVDGKMVFAHRWAYAHCVGPIPDGLTIDHLCSIRACVNPAHLEPVTPRENTLRMHQRMDEWVKELWRREDFVHPTLKTQCIHGHPFDEGNVYCRPRGRGCRACDRERSRAYRARHRAGK